MTKLLPDYYYKGILGTSGYVPALKDVESREDSWCPSINNAYPAGFNPIHSIPRGRMCWVIKTKRKKK